MTVRFRTIRRFGKNDKTILIIRIEKCRTTALTGANNTADTILKSGEHPKTAENRTSEITATFGKTRISCFQRNPRGTTMNKFGIFTLRTAPVWGTVLTSAAVFAGSTVFQWGGSCTTCSEPVQVCSAPQCAPQQVTAYKTVYETVYDQKEVTEYKPVWVTEMRTRKYTVSRPITETAMREETYTVRVPYKETSYKTEVSERVRYVEETAEREEVQTVCRPVQKTGQRENVYTVRRPVTKTVMVNQTRTVPVQVTEYQSSCEDHGYFKQETVFKPKTTLFPNKLEWQSAKCETDACTGETVQKNAGLYWVKRDTPEKGTYEVKKVWVPNQITVQKPVTRTVFKQVCEQVPQTQVTYEDQVVRETVPYTYTEMVQEQVVRKIPQKSLKPIRERVENKIPVEVCKWREEVRTRQVPYTVCRTVQEEKVEQYPVRVCKQTPVTKTVCTPRVVSRTVPYSYCVTAPVVCGACPVDASPIPSAAPAVDTIPPANYQPTPAAPSNTAENSILNRDDNVTPATYLEPTPAPSSTPAPASDASNAQFENVYNSDSAAPSLAPAKEEAVPEPVAPADVKETPREITAPGVPLNSAAAPAQPEAAQPETGVNAASGQPRNEVQPAAETAPRDPSEQPIPIPAENAPY